MKLIINADDFGLSRGVNFGILESMKNGILTSTTMMMNAPALDHAIDLMQHNQMNVGIHLVATMFKPLTDCPSLVKADGVFDKQKYFERTNEIDLNELKKEWIAQMELFISRLGYKPTHIDSHHHTHLVPEVKAVVLEIADMYQLQVRNIDTNHGEHIHFFSEFYGDQATLEVLERAISSGPIVEMMSHPAFIDNDLMNATTYNMDRKVELALFLDPKVKQRLNELGVELISYRDTKKD